jgi:alpha-amylase
MAVLNLNYVVWDQATQSKVVGWPLPKTPAGLYAYQRIEQAAPEYKAAGFEAALFQPSTLGAGGEYSSGYDKKDDYILDGTSWGSGAMGKSAVAALHKNGLKVYGDLVLHQMDGYPNQQYTTKRFPKTPACFAVGAGQTARPGNVQPDSVPDTTGDWPDGDLCAYCPQGSYMWNGAIDAAIWLVEQMGFDGFRIDEAKDLHAPFLCALIDALVAKFPESAMFFFGEYFDGNPYALGGWVNYWMGRRASVLDFMFKFNVGDICNNNSNIWMGQLSNIGYNLIDSYKSLTFCENADTDTSPGEQIVDNKMLGYAIMLTFPGNPMIYYRDWSADPGCYGLKTGINNLLWINNNLAQGGFVTRNADYQTFAHERLGYGNAPGCVCFFNNDQYNEHAITVQTRYPSGTRLHEYTGNSGYNADKWTDYWGCIDVTIPRNVNGCNSLVYAPYV